MATILLLTAGVVTQKIEALWYLLLNVLINPTYLFLNACDATFVDPSFDPRQIVTTSGTYLVKSHLIAGSDKSRRSNISGNV